MSYDPYEDYEHVGKVDHIDEYSGSTYVIIRGDDGLTYGVKLNVIPAKQRRYIYKGKQLAFDVGTGKLASKARVL